MKGSRIKLTTNRIEAASCPPDKRHILLWDAEQPGLAVRVYATGRKVFVAVYRSGEGGRTAALRWLTLGEVGRISLKDARQATEAGLGAVAKGSDPSVERKEERRREKARLDAALDDYERALERRQVVKRKEVMSLLRRELLDSLGKVDMTSLDRRTLVGRIREIEASKRPGTAKDFRSKVAVFLGWAVEHGLINASPLAGYRRQRATRAERLERPGRAIADKELLVLWQAAGEASDRLFGAYIKALLLLGQRRAETAAMRWSDVDLDRGIWTIQAADNKAGRTHRVPLPPAMVEMLAGLPRLKGTDYVFPGRGGQMMTGWSKRLLPVYAATKAAGMEPWTLHDLRRTVRSGLGTLGVDPNVAELLLNHAIGAELRAVYDRAEYWPQRAEALARWSRHVVKLSQPSLAPNVVPLRPAVGS